MPRPKRARPKDPRKTRRVLARALGRDFPKQQMPMQGDPEAVFRTDHHHHSPMVLVRLDRARCAAMPGLIAAAWRLVAPNRLIAQYDATAH